MHFRPAGRGLPGRLLAGALVAWTLIALSGVAQAKCRDPLLPPPTCPGGPDADADGVCDAADNCVSVANANQCDTWGPKGGLGDACDPITGPPANYKDLNVVKVKLRGGTAGRGKSVFKGDFILGVGETFNPIDDHGAHGGRHRSRSGVAGSERQPHSSHRSCAPPVAGGFAAASSPINVLACRRSLISSSRTTTPTSFGPSSSMSRYADSPSKARRSPSPSR